MLVFITTQKVLEASKVLKASGKTLEARQKCLRTTEKLFEARERVLEASEGMLEAREKVLEARENMLEDNRKAVQVKREGTQSKGKHARDNERDISSPLDRCSHTAIRPRASSSRFSTLGSL